MELKTHCGWKASMKQYDVDVQVQVRDEHAEVSVRLSPESMGRRGRVAHGPASLNATIGYAMCIMAQPQAGEVFVDPMCGAGTVLLERAAFDTPAALVGGDRHAPALEWARANFTAAEIDAGLVHWDAARLPLGDATVDKLVCNMPWGRRIGSHRVNTALYRRFMDEVARVLKPSGRAVLLTLERRLMAGIVARHTELYIARTRAVAVGGLEPAIHIVRVRAR